MNNLAMVTHVEVHIAPMEVLHGVEHIASVVHDDEALAVGTIDGKAWPQLPLLLQHGCMRLGLTGLVAIESLHRPVERNHQGGAILRALRERLLSDELHDALGLRFQEQVNTRLLVM